MQRLKYRAPAHSRHHTVVVADQKLRDGDEITVSDEQALELITNPNVTFEEVGGPDQSSDGRNRMSRSELDELATTAGVENPAGLRTKRDVIEAIDAAIDEPEPQPAGEPEAAEDGEGHDENEQED